MWERKKRHKVGTTDRRTRAFFSGCSPPLTRVRVAHNTHLANDVQASNAADVDERHDDDRDLVWNVCVTVCVRGAGRESPGRENKREREGKRPRRAAPRGAVFCFAFSPVHSSSISFPSLTGDSFSPGDSSV